MKKALAVAMALMLLFPLWSCRSDKPTDASSEAGSEPDSYAYAIRVTINPQMTLFLDAQNQVISFRADNEDAAADFSGVELTGKSLNEALDVIVDRAVERAGSRTAETSRSRLTPQIHPIWIGKRCWPTPSKKSRRSLRKSS